jgi:glutathione synthase/RimK-type ligase-like ATP-grasp enzyme
LILVVSHRADEHANAVLAALRRRGTPSRLLDVSRFPTELSLTIGAGGEGDGPILAPRRGRSLRLDEVQAVWWRRPQPFVLHDDLRGENRRIFAWREAREAFAGMWQSLDVRWVNNPVRDEAATHKPWQLTLAERLGLRVPRTCITSDPARARAFVESVRPGRAVFKSLQATRADWRATRLVRAKELGRLDVVRYAPVIFQEYVEAGVDVRVTAVARRLFATAIHVSDTDYPADFRVGFDQARVEPIRLPVKLAARLRRLVSALGLAYAAIDLRRDDDGEYYFLEVNPSGQWLFIEERTGQPITDAVARLLATGR